MFELLLHAVWETAATAATSGHSSGSIAANQEYHPVRPCAADSSSRCDTCYRRYIVVVCAVAAFAPKKVIAPPACIHRTKQA